MLCLAWYILGIRDVSGFLFCFLSQLWTSLSSICQVKAQYVYNYLRGCSFLRLHSALPLSPQPTLTISFAIGWSLLRGPVLLLPGWPLCCAPQLSALKPLSGHLASVHMWLHMFVISPGPAHQGHLLWSSRFITPGGGGRRGAHKEVRRGWCFAAF